ncbi:MAG TPA: hypothetical protein VK162_15965 [Streptosporangiaceae bacterium]|nr:hypothetical protein [Streptosporangiaceae bacterium]
MSERHHQCVDDLTAADGPGDSLHRSVLRPVADEYLSVEIAHFIPADPAPS